MDQLFAELMKWTLAAGPFAAIVFFGLWKLERDERHAALLRLEQYNLENKKEYIAIIEKFLTSTLETSNAVKTLTELLRGGRNNA